MFIRYVRCFISHEVSEIAEDNAITADEEIVVICLIGIFIALFF
jgi:hypothetical protein